ncbi:MAG: LPD1 domain-containing protein [Roseburia faecis]
MEGQMSLFNTPEVSGTSALKVSRDFGEHIGGARKELWSAGGINLEDLLDMNDAEKAKFVKKDNIWKKPGYEQMVEAGVPKVVAYAIKEVRNAIPAKPYVSYFEQDDPEKVKYRMECYVKFVTMIRDTMSGVSSEEEFMEKQQVVYNQIVDPERSTRYSISSKTEYTGLFQTKLLRAIRCNHQTFCNYIHYMEMEQFAVKKEDKVPAGWKIEKYSPDGFYSRSRVGCIRDTYIVSKGYSVIEKNIPTYEEALCKCQEYAKQLRAKKPRKASATPKQLKRVERTGLPDVRNGRDIVGEDFLKDFGIRGGEFGNWMSEKDAQASLNMAYEAFCDFADVLGIPLSSVSFCGRLAIAFGARGQGSAVAHYDPLREVINITKMKGAGSLGHEMFHALDDIVAKKLGLKKMMTESFEKEKIPESVRNVISAMQYRKATKEEIEAEKAKKIGNTEKLLQKCIDSVFPADGLTDAQVKKRAELVRNIFADKEEHLISIDGTATAAIEALSSYKKEVTGRVINKESRKDLFWTWYRYERAVTASYNDMQMLSEYHKESKKMDDCTAKDKFGYWSSTVEMFARAGACYLTDMLKAKGAKSDYLSGHSESCVGMDKNINPVYAMPRGEERKAINAAIHDMIEDLKAKELI